MSIQSRAFKVFLIAGALGFLGGSRAYSQMIPFGFFKKITAALNFDFISDPSLPSQLTLTRASTATYVDSSGTVKTAAANTARFHYDMTTLTLKGLLLEPAATNMIACSENVALGSCWQKDGSAMTVTLDAGTAPDGTMTADRLEKGATDSWAYPTWPTTSVGVPYTFSIYMKAVTAGTVRISFQETAGAYTTYSTTDFAVTTSWKRYSITGTKTTSNGMRAVIALYSGFATQVLIWGAQYEQGTIATSYIPTAASAASRSGDQLTLTSMTGINATGGALFAEYENISAESAADYNVFGLYATNAAGTFRQNAIEISDNGTTVESNVTTASTAVFSPAGTLNAAGSINRQALSYQSGNFLISINRAAAISDTTGTLPATLGYGYIGSQPDGNMRSRYLRKIQYYNAPLDSATLQGL